MKQRDEIQSQRAHLEYALQQEDEIINNHTYKYEQELLEYIKSGDVEQVQENLKNHVFPDYPQLLDFYVKKNEEYMAVIAVALTARAVIQGGVTSAESFRMSDYYLKKISSSPDINRIIQIRDEALLEYTKLVRERKRGTKRGLYVEEAKQYIAAQVFKKISVKDVADALNINAIYLERIFKDAEGLTIGQYIQREKVGRAKNFLMYSDRSIMEIGEYLGFASQSHFGQIFKKEVGMTPKQFRIHNRLSGF